MLHVSYEIILWLFTSENYYFNSVKYVHRLKKEKQWTYNI